MSGKPGRSGGHNRLSADEHRRRGTFQTVRHGEPTAASPDEVEHLDWLEGLPAAAKRLGEAMLTDGVVKDREKFREYLFAFAAYRAMPRNNDTPIEELAAMQAHVACLLDKLRWRRR